MGIICLWSLFACLACTNHNQNDVDKLNEISYAYHYKSIDSTYLYAQKAAMLSANYPSGNAEALNNLAFVNIAKMNYQLAERQLDSVMAITDNQIELLIADIQMMRLCQRQAHNKEFYDYREHAKKRMRRIHESQGPLSEHNQKRLIYAESEYSFVASTYYYYVGLYAQSRKALNDVDQIDVLQSDTAQYLNWLYLYGSGSMIEKGTKEEILQKEYDKLLECFLISRSNGYTYWEANAMQSLSEHLVDNRNLIAILKNNPISIRYFNADNMPDSLLAGYLAQKSADIFKNYGDVYQTAGSLRTLALCFWGIKDYRSALLCLQYALGVSDKIKQAPDLIASIHEQLSLVYSAMNDKHHSDINRNTYLDMQERTRQDMELDARAAKLENTSHVMNVMIIVIVLLIIVFVLLFIYLIKNKSRLMVDPSEIVKAFAEWEKLNDLQINRYKDKIEELRETNQIANLNISKNKHRSIENCAKISLVDSVMPLIDRMKNEVDKLVQRNEPDDMRSFRYKYISELATAIEKCNTALTSWIQLRQGEVGLRIESFPLQQLFTIVSRSKAIFAMQGVNLEVESTEAIVKADKILTLFMINTIADNARKFTSQGGRVKISAEQTNEYVEISVSDTGKGMNQDELKDVFSKKISGGHGFGLLNCRGIVNKYRKTSNLFNCCEISAESEVGKGSRFFFRLPKGVARILAIVFFTVAMSPCCTSHAASQPMAASTENNALLQSTNYADSAYKANLNSEYEKAIAFADSAILCLNKNYTLQHPRSTCVMRFFSDRSHEPAELIWFRKGVKTNYSVILSIRNECAVAALALHRWELYHYNNGIYTRLFKEVSADQTLGEYCSIMQRTETNKNIAIVLLIILFVAVIIIGYILYYRRVIRLHSVNELADNIVGILTDDSSVEMKSQAIKQLSATKFSEVFKDILTNIAKAFQDAENRMKSLSIEKSQLKDTINQQRYENDRLYISNNIMENCLSTIKHETMYYPSRICQCVEMNNSDDNIDTISSLVNYYKQLYSILCEQVHREIDSMRHSCRPVSLSKYIGEEICTLGNDEMVNYLFQILKKQNKGIKPYCSIQHISDKYVHINAVLGEVKLSEEECHTLFTPEACHIPYLICRQIIRDIGAMSNLCGCGITVIPCTNNTLTLQIVLPKHSMQDVSHSGT